MPPKRKPKAAQSTTSEDLKTKLASSSPRDTNTKKPKLCKVRCSRPNSPTQVEFNITEEPNLRNDCYEIRSASSTSPLGNYCVQKHNNEKKQLLDFKQYDYVLDEWLAGLTDVWCQIYKGWGEYRPTEELRMVLQGMLQVVCNLHRRHRFHGALDDLGNYGLRFVKSYIGEEEIGSCEVTLLNANPGISSVDLSNQDFVSKEIQKDMASLCTAIFDKILKCKEIPIAKDLEHLKGKMIEASVCRQNLTTLRSVIAMHPSLWHWLSKVHYFAKVWLAYTQIETDETAKNIIHNSIMNMRCAFDWQSRIPKDGPFAKLLLADLSDPNVLGYRNKQPQLILYVRDVNQHINDCHEDTLEKLYFDEDVESRYLEEQYVEKALADIFPLLLVELFSELVGDGLYL